MEVHGSEAVLRLSEERDPHVLARFVRLRVIDPEDTCWRHKIGAATRWLRETGITELRVPHVYVTPGDWDGVGGYPLGQWVTDQRRYYSAGAL
ncbi:helicase associated domain-containing protein [Streptomyces sp. NBC_00825]|uniref:helicase associated domain-containing protein n=1 Tax=unclassified Streptomyces TaxID=2593676 RepID=UPI00225AA80A|nr:MULTISPECIES: helicase associated domain-containing protein [unclassified Streptomyces]WTB59235.1 helicase associated domain-containing protein [Streptomyces sp. NBC_00826]WTH87893.1 helicase associated domain-containing protein [Streptomyces sp. NBC_00825]WTH96620.1 helicase associated domain-containing protein [Streptomyces sp. NBC_00822]MCX4870096.1 helicase associated domain-containing protein [Streptomyces sp. NBC_00906]MCX4901259.1 helicase associated domain-containing protein [Strept